MHRAVSISLGSEGSLLYLEYVGKVSPSINTIGVSRNVLRLLASIFTWWCHTLISSGDHYLLACDHRLTTSKCLMPIVVESVKSRNILEIKTSIIVQSVKIRNIPESQKEHCCIIRKVPQHFGGQKEYHCKIREVSRCFGKKPVKNTKMGVYLANWGCLNKRECI